MTLVSDATTSSGEDTTKCLEHWLTSFTRMIDEFTDVATWHTVPIHKTLTCKSLCCLYTILVGKLPKVQFSEVICRSAMDSIRNICVNKPQVLRGCFDELWDALSSIVWRGELGKIMFDSGVFHSILRVWGEELTVRKAEDPIYLITPFFNLLCNLPQEDSNLICVSLMTDRAFIDLFTRALRECESLQFCVGAVRMLSHFVKADSLLLKSVIPIEILKHFHLKEHGTCPSAEMKVLGHLIDRLENFIVSPAYEDMKEYVFSNLVEFCHPALINDDIMNLICEYAIEGYRVGQQIDCLGPQNVWCAAEVLEIDTLLCKIKVHYVGWDGYDVYIDVPSNRLAPAFTHTGEVPAHTAILAAGFATAFAAAAASSGVVFLKPGPRVVAVYRELVKLEPCLGAPSDEVLSWVIRRGNRDQQRIVNYLRLLNSVNLCLQ
eukprot:TRINITY_DN3115_c0_g1_i1.p1 TRINITY_DN3115_c0_g1~~TRINITY_DN3115_c0_g1_i1.p1  ORF type:complete len:434 (-),score=78.98 TRINITY_DN3115_c0_g1_i1:18-1319(-)